MAHTTDRQRLKAAAATMRDANIALLTIIPDDPTINFPALLTWLATDLPVIMEKMAKLYDILFSDTTKPGA